MLTLPEARVARLEAGETDQGYIHLPELGPGSLDFDYDTFVVELESGGEYRVEIQLFSTPFSQGSFRSITTSYDTDGDYGGLLMSASQVPADNRLFSSVARTEEDGDHYLAVTMNWPINPVDPNEDELPVGPVAIPYEITVVEVSGTDGLAA